MRIRNLSEAKKSLALVNRDKQRLMCCLVEIQQKKLHKNTQLLLMHLWPECVGDEQMFKWKQELENRISEMDTYIESVNKYIANFKSRCCIPKKKQRLLGMLPPV